MRDRESVARETWQDRRQFDQETRAQVANQAIMIELLLDIRDLLLKLSEGLPGHAAKQ